MSRFHFPFHSLLKKREEEEQEKWKELTLIEDHQQEMRSILDATKKKLSQAKREAKRARNEASSASIHETLSLLIEHYNQEIDQQNLSIKYTDRQLKEKKADIYLTLQKKKILENLKLDMKAKWDKEQQKKEQSFYDDQASLRHTRKTRHL